MPVRMHVLYVVANMEVPLMCIFMEILILLFRELYNSYLHEFTCFCFVVIHFHNYYMHMSGSLVFISFPFSFHKLPSYFPCSEWLSQDL